MAWGAVAASVGASLIGGASSAKAQREANRANVKMQRENMAWQERMSNTAHQRQVADMKAAGLNPMLSAMQGGASTGSAQMIEQKPADDAAGIESAINSALETRRLKKEMDAVETQTQLNKSTAQLHKEQAYLMRDQANKMVDERFILDEKRKQERMNTEAMQFEKNARIQSAKYLEQQAKQDMKFQNFDNYSKRINTVIDGVSNAAGIINPLSKLKLGGKNVNSAKSSRSYTEEKYNSQGEHIGSRSRRYHD